MSKDTSGPAFPVPIPAGHYWSGAEPNGMTLRQHYAGLAMQGIISAASPGTNLNKKSCAEYAFAMADAMIAEGNK